MQLVIRKFRPSDTQAVCDLFSLGIGKEHVSPCFYNAMTSPLYLTITASLCIGGYFLGGWFGAALLPALFMCIVYYCSYEVYAAYVRSRLQTDMQDITGIYMSRPGNCFWVAEAEEGGRAQILGTVAVMAIDHGTERVGELFRMITSPKCRRMGLGMRLTQTVIDFCKENGFSKVVLETSSTQASAVALYKKAGFKIVRKHKQTESTKWITNLARITVLYMEKHI